MGLKDQETAWQREIAGEPRAFGTRGFLHHLNEHLLAGLKQFGNTGSTFLEAQRTEIGDVNETVFFALADIHESGIDAWEDVFNGAEINITNLVTTLSNDQFINPFVVENCGDAQLLSDDDLLWHGLRPPLTGSPKRTEKGTKMLCSFQLLGAEAAFQRMNLEI